MLENSLFYIADVILIYGVKWFVPKASCIIYNFKGNEVDK